MVVGEDDRPKTGLLLESQRPGQAASVERQDVVDDLPNHTSVPAFEVVGAEHPELHVHLRSECAANRAVF